MLDHSLDRVFQALADPSRRAMVERLCEGPASVSELARPFSMTLAAVVQHVQVLEASGLETNGGGPEGGPHYSYEAIYRDIVPDERIVYTTQMHADDRLISVSVAS